MTLAHRVALLERGVLQQLDTPANIYNAPANLFVAGFIGSPPMNFLKGELVDGRFSSVAGSFGTEARASEQAAVAGIRPEDGRITAPGEGKIQGAVYATELMGDHVLATCRCGARHHRGQGRQDFRAGDRRAGRHRFRQPMYSPVRRRAWGSHWALLMIDASV